MILNFHSLGLDWSKLKNQPRLAHKCANENRTFLGPVCGILTLFISAISLFVFSSSLEWNFIWEREVMPYCSIVVIDPGQKSWLLCGKLTEQTFARFLLLPLLNLFFPTLLIISPTWSLGVKHIQKMRGATTCFVGVKCQDNSLAQGIINILQKLESLLNTYGTIHIEF